MSPRFAGRRGRHGHHAGLCALAALATALLAGCAAHPPDALTWAEHERRLYAQGLLRTERAPADAPVSAADLTRNFSRIAFGLEPLHNAGRAGRDILRRWERPVRWRLHATGDGRPELRADVTATFARLAEATRHDIAEADAGAPANLDLWLLGPDDYLRARDWARRSGIAGQRSLIDAFQVNDLPCMGQFRYSERTRDREPAGAVRYALVLVRKGFSRGFRLSCFEEELAQVMGLANDDARVRPSVFNDDEEFALLTRHDETLLRVLYDPRLRPGMRPAEAMPIVQRILAGEPSG